MSPDNLDAVFCQQLAALPKPAGIPPAGDSLMEFATHNSTAKFTWEDILAGYDAMEALDREYRLREPQWNPPDSMLKTPIYPIDLPEPISLRVWYPFAMRTA